MEDRPLDPPVTVPISTSQVIPWPLRVVRWLASGGMVVAALWAVAIAVSNKQAIDVYPVAMLIWLVVSFQAIQRVRNAESFVVATALLLVADALADILCQGSWLYGPWALINEASRGVVSVSLIAEWRWDLGATVNVPIYDLAFWVVAVSLRTLALATGLLDRAMTGEMTRARRWLGVPTLLAIGTALLYVSHVPDVVRFMLLGYPPFLRHAPLDFTNLSPLLGLTWNTARIDALAGLSLIVAGLLFEWAIALERA